jgi:hypothetical protein
LTPSPSRREAHGECHPDLLSVEIDYPRRDFRLLGARIHWIWPFLFVSLLAGYLLRRGFRVQF